MTRILATTFVIVCVSATAVFAAEQTWTGQISDSVCGLSHEAVAGQNGFTDSECAVACIDPGKYIFVTEDRKQLPIANQDFAGLKEHAAQTVKLTGEQKGNAIVVSKIETVAKP